MFKDEKASTILGKWDPGLSLFLFLKNTLVFYLKQLKIIILMLYYEVNFIPLNIP